MGHHITAVIGRTNEIERLVRELELPSATALPQGLAIVPLGEAQIDNLTALQPGEHVHGFTYLGSTIEEKLQRASLGAKFLYIETEYFGGIGGQSAALFENGKTIWRASEGLHEDRIAQSFFRKWFPRRQQKSKSPISRGLAALGVTIAGEFDEFDAIGLVNFRTMETLGLTEIDDD